MGLFIYHVLVLAQGNVKLNNIRVKRIRKELFFDREKTSLERRNPSERSFISTGHGARQFVPAACDRLLRKPNKAQRERQINCINPQAYKCECGRSYNRAKWANSPVHNPTDRL